MLQYLPLIICLGIPIFLVSVVRTNGAILFLCVAASALLQQFLDPDAAKLANSLLPRSNIDYISLGVLLVPAAIASALYAGTVKKALLPLHIIIAALAGLCVVLLADRFLPGSLITSFSSTTTAKLIRDYQTLIIAVGFLLSVVVLRSGHGKAHSKKARHH